MAKILIVENESRVALAIKDIIEIIGYESSAVVETGEEALEAAMNCLPDLALMDIRLGGRIDGIEAAEKLKKDFDVPVIFLTGYVDPETLEKAKKAEPYGFIIKPFDERNLRTNIKMALHKHSVEMKKMEEEKELSQNLNDNCKKIKEQLSMFDSMAKLASRQGEFVSFLQDINLKYEWFSSDFNGFEAGKIKGLTDFELFSHKEARNLDKIKTDCIKKEKKFRQNIKLKIGGKVITYQIILEPVISDNNEIIGIAGILIENAGYELLTTTDDINNILDSYSMLISLGYVMEMAMPELMQPLAAIRVGSDGILFWNKQNKNILPSTIIGMMKGISESVNMIDQAIRNLRILREGIDRIEKYHVDLNQCINSSVNMINQNVHSFEITLITNLHPEPIEIISHEAKLQLLISNILINIIKTFNKENFTPKTILIKSSINDSGPYIEIADNCSWHSIDKLGLIAEKEYFTETSKNIEETELIITKRLAAKVDASIHVDKNEMGGATFLIHFNNLQ